MKSNIDRAHATLKDLSATNRAMFFGPFVLLALGRAGDPKPHVKLEVHVQTDGLHLAYIENLRKSGGYGKKALDLLCKIADCNACPIMLEVDADFGRTNRQLKEFYKQFGFKFKGNFGVRRFCEMTGK